MNGRGSALVLDKVEEGGYGENASVVNLTTFVVDTLLAVKVASFKPRNKSTPV
jgi:hypothetical protein